MDGGLSETKSVDGNVDPNCTLAAFTPEAHVGGLGLESRGGGGGGGKLVAQDRAEIIIVNRPTNRAVTSADVEQQERGIAIGPVSK